MEAACCLHISFHSFGTRNLDKHNDVGQLIHISSFTSNVNFWLPLGLCNVYCQQLEKNVIMGLEWYTLLYSSILGWYCQISNIRCKLVGNKLVDHSDVVGTVPTGNVFFLDLTPGFSGLGKGNYKTRWEALKFLALMWLIQKVWRYLYFSQWCFYFQCWLGQ